MKEIDARGLSCPAPVLQTKAVLDTDKPNEVKVIVDNEAAKQNVSRFLKTSGFKIYVEEIDEDFSITGHCDIDTIPGDRPADTEESEATKIMVLIATDRMGYGDDELGRKLLVNFIRTLKEMGKELWRLVFVNNGVKLTVEGSEILPVLKEYENNGLHILVCGTCLNHFNLLDKKKVGETTNMLDIVTSMQLADKVINV